MKTTRTGALCAGDLVYIDGIPCRIIHVYRQAIPTGKIKVLDVEGVDMFGLSHATGIITTDYVDTPQTLYEVYIQDPKVQEFVEFYMKKCHSTEQEAINMLGHYHWDPHRAMTVFNYFGYFG